MSETIEQIKERAQQLRHSSDATNQHIDALNDSALRLHNAETLLSEELSRQALQMAARNDYPRGRAYALCNLGRFCQQIDQYQKAERFLDESRQIFLRLQDDFGLASVMHGLGAVKLGLGEYETALENLTTVQNLREKLNDQLPAASVLIDIGIIHSQMGDYSQALDYYYSGLQRAVICGSSVQQSVACLNLGDLLWRVVGGAESIQMSEQTLTLFKSGADRRRVSISLNNIGAAHQSVGNFGEAMRCFEDALLMAQAVHNIETQAEAKIGIGRIHCDTNEAEKALAQLFEALQLTQNIGNRSFESQALLQLGQAHKLVGNEPESIILLERALALSQTINARETACKTHLALSEICQKQNKASAALYHYQAFHQVWSEMYNFASARQVERLMLSQGLGKRFRLKRLLEPQKVFRLNQTALSPRRLSKIKEFISHHLEENISTEHLAEIAGFARNYFTRVFKEATGHTPHQYPDQAAHRTRQTVDRNYNPAALRNRFAVRFQRSIASDRSVSPRHRHHAQTIPPLIVKKLEAAPIPANGQAVIVFRRGCSFLITIGTKLLFSKNRHIYSRTIKRSVFL